MTNNDKVIKTLLVILFFSLAVANVAQTTATFNYTGGIQTFSVPSGVTSISIEA